MAYVSFFFVTLLIGFYMVVFFFAGTLDDDRRSILLILHPYLAGFSVFFMGGTALFKFTSQIGSSTKIAFSATAGTAVFAWVYLYPPPVITAKLVPKDEAFRIVVMDSKIRVYNTTNYATNAQKVRAIIREMPHSFKVTTELTIPNYDQEEYIIEQKPDLIVIHLSSFYPFDRNISDVDLRALDKADSEFRQFVEYVLNKAKTKILVYTRGPPDLNRFKSEIAAGIQRGWNRQNDFIGKHRDRVRLYVLPKGMTFEDRQAARDLKNQVSDILSLPAG